MTKVICGLSCLLLVLAAGTVNAQSSPYSDSTQTDWADQYRFFDQPVDAETYLVRPGEILHVTFVNAQVTGLRLLVDPEGRIIHPTLGVIDLSHKSLAEARNLLDSKLKQLYSVDEMVISIAEPRRIAISVSGAVKNPGLYEGSTSQRVSELVDAAGGVLRNGSTRNIVFSGGGADLTVDLDRATYLGDNSANPCIYAGYSILVPDRHQDRVQVVGEVIRPREVELIAGDDIATLVALAGGLRSSALIDSVQVIGAGRRLTGPDHQPRSGDIVFVPNRLDAAGQEPVIIFGAVEAPGQYPFDPALTLADLVARAGGFSEDASRSLMTLFRRAGADAWGRVSDWRYPITGSLAGSGDIMLTGLQPADSVYVPFYVGYVRVSGQVLSPGLFPYVPDRDALFYINAAGGYLPSADKDRVDMFNRVARVTTSISPGVQVHEGNELIVNLREELQ